jgi:hypothetical protein
MGGTLLNPKLKTLNTKLILSRNAKLKTPTIHFGTRNAEPGTLFSPLH